MAQRGYPPPASLLAEQALGMPAGQIFHLLSYGQGNMPAYATQLSREDRWHVISHLQSLHSKHRQATIASEPSPAAP